MKLFSFLFLIPLALEEFNCAPLLDWSSEREIWRMGVRDCGFGGSYHYGRYYRPWLIQKYLQDPDYETKSNEHQLSKKTVDQLSKETVDQLSKKTAGKPSNKAFDKPIDIPTKPLIEPLIDISSKTLDEPSRKFLDKPSTNSAKSSSENLSDYAKLSPFDDMPAENLDDFSKSKNVYSFDTGRTVTNRY